MIVALFFLDMMALCHDQQIDTGLLHKAITNQVSQQQTHSHMETCKKGVLGCTGCCLSMPFGSLSTTSPVVLKPINTDGEANDSYTEDQAMCSRGLSVNH